MELIKVLSFIGFGVVIGQVYVHFALKEFWREHGGNEQTEKGGDK